MGKDITMSSKSLIVTVAIGLTLTIGAVFAAEESEEDSAAGLPAAYAKNYLVARSTMSPDKKFAVIYPTLDFSESKEAADMVVALKPFSVLAKLPAADLYFQNRSNSGIRADWAKDGSVALIILDSKWGPGDVFVVELADGKVKRVTNLDEKLRQLVSPMYKSAKKKPESYNDTYDFIFEQGDTTPCALGGNKVVKFDLIATNDPKGISDRPWSVQVKAEWDIAEAKFVSQKITPEKRR
jgi:hypothetical protein